MNNTNNVQTQSDDNNCQAQEDVNSKRTRCEIWTRVMGYHRPVSQYNIGKKSEHYSRKHFKEEQCVESNASFASKYCPSYAN